MNMASFKLPSLVLSIAVFVLHRSVSAFNETAVEIKAGDIQSRKSSVNSKFYLDKLTKKRFF